MKHFVLGQGLFLKYKKRKSFFITDYTKIFTFFFNGYQLNIQIPQGGMEVTCRLKGGNA